MHILLAIASACFFLFAVFAFASSKSDLQIGIAVTSAAAGFILFGLAGIAARLNDIWRDRR